MVLKMTKVKFIVDLAAIILAWILIGLSIQSINQDLTNAFGDLGRWITFIVFIIMITIIMLWLMRDD